MRWRRGRQTLPGLVSCRGGPPSPWHAPGSPSGPGAPQQHLELSHSLSVAPALPSASGLGLLGSPTHTAWFPRGGVAQNGAPGAPTLRTASPALTHPHLQAVPVSSTTLHVPIAWPGLWAIPRSPVAFRAHTEAQPSSSRPPGVHRGPEAPGVGGKPSCPGPTASEDTGRICIQALWLQVTSAGVLAWG